LKPINATTGVQFQKWCINLC